jgi:hypothetical protein
MAPFAEKKSISIGSSSFAYSGKTQHRRSKKQPFWVAKYHILNCLL